MLDAIDRGARRFRDADLFSACGSAASLPDCERVDSWRKAAQKALSTKWSKLKFGAQNDVSGQLCVAFRDRYRTWNNDVDYIRQTVLPRLMEEKIRPILSPVGLNEDAKADLLAVIEDDVMNLLLAASYADVVSHSLLRAMEEVYLAGHFPCGWEGRYPEGKLLIF